MTTSSLAEIKNREEVQKLIDEYEFGAVEPEFTDDDEIIINGYTAFDPERDGEASDLEFLKRLQGFLKDDEVLTIQSMSHVRTRFPFSAIEYTVSNQMLRSQRLGQVSDLH